MKSLAGTYEGRLRSTRASLTIRGRTACRRAVPFFVLLLVAAGVSLAVTSCSREPTAVPAMPTRGAAEVLPTAEPGPEAFRLIFAHPKDATKLDPSDVTDSESFLATWQVYEGLTRFKAGTTEIEPSLATDWTTSEDGLTWTFNLREGVKFHDGTDFGPDAVVWNFNRWFDPKNAYHFSDWEFEYWLTMFQGLKGEVDAAKKPKSYFESIEATGPMSVTIKLNRPSAPLLQNLAMSSFAFSSPAALEATGALYGTADGKPIAASTGPFKVKEWVVGDHITLERNDAYWGDAPKLKEIELRVIPDNTARYLSLANGEIDGMNQVNPEDIEKAKGNSEAQVLFEPANNVGYLGFNQAHAPWGNQDCRLAVAHAIDKQAIVDALYAGDAEPAVEMMPPGLWGYNASLKDYPFDMTKAKEYLDKCLAEEKMPAEVVFYVPPTARFYFPKPKELGEFIQASLVSLGIVTKIESPDWGTVFLPDVREGKADLFLLGWGGDNGDPDNYLCQFFCGGEASFNSTPDGKAAPPDKALNDLLREASTLTDQAARQSKYEEANARILEVVPAVPVVHRTPPLIFRTNVKGYTPSPLQQILIGLSKQ
jgi:peptide/nickel transport system substrate-binding protein